MNILLEFILSISLLAAFALGAALLMFVALITYLLVRHGFRWLRWRGKQARYVTKAYRRTGRVPAPIRTDIVVRL